MDGGRDAAAAPAGRLAVEGGGPESFGGRGQQRLRPAAQRRLEGPHVQQQEQVAIRPGGRGRAREAEAVHQGEVLEAGPLGDGLERLGPAEDGRAGSRQQGDVGEATALGVARVGDVGEVGEQTPRRGGGHHGTPGRARTCPVMPEIPRSLKFNLSVTLGRRAGQRRFGPGALP